MISYLIGVDGGGSGTRVRLARADGQELAVGHGGPSALAFGVDKAWQAIDAAIVQAFATAGIARPDNAVIGLGLGLAGVHNRQWAAGFAAANPGYGMLELDTDAFTTLMGAHGGGPGAVVAIGTGSVGIVLQADGSRRDVGGWGFPAGDEASGAWLGLRAIAHLEKVLDGRRPASPLAANVLAACGGGKDALYAWLAAANQTAYATLAPLVVDHAARDDVARDLMADAGEEIAAIVAALDPGAALPVAICGGLGAALRPYLSDTLLGRCVEPRGDSASGALTLIACRIRSDHEVLPVGDAP